MKIHDKHKGAPDPPGAFKRVFSHLFSEVTANFFTSMNYTVNSKIECAIKTKLLQENAEKLSLHSDGSNAFKFDDTIGLCEVLPIPGKSYQVQNLPF